MSTDSPAKRALLIGIDDYDIPFWRLDGCVNDVRMMGSLLEEKFGFPSDNVTMLLDKKATQENILTAMKSLVEATGKDDIVVVHYAGHGSQREDEDGDEPDGLDETICPVDTDHYRGKNTDITDDEIDHFLRQLSAKTRYITLFFDCCHSGTVTREATATKSRSAPRDERGPEAFAPRGPVAPASRSPRPAGPSGWVPLDSNYVLIAGCRSDQKSKEVRIKEAGKTIHHGALSYYLTGQLQQAKPADTYEDVFERARSRVIANDSSQHPQMEGMGQRELFGTTEFEASPYVRVEGRSEELVTLAGGAALGMTVGSVWAVHPPGTKSPQGEPLGRVKIESVDVISSEARVVEETVDGAVAEDCRAYAESLNLGEMRLTYEVAGEPARSEELAALRALLEISKLLAPAEEEMRADARVQLIEPREKAGEEDPAPQLGALSEPTWVAVAESGELLFPPKRLDDLETIRDNLDTLSRHRHALAIENPDPGSELRRAIKMELLRQNAEGDWVPARSEEAGGTTVFEEGERVGIRVTNGHSEPVYVNLLLFDEMGAIAGPKIPATRDPLHPEGSIEIGVGNPGLLGDITLNLSETFKSFAGDPDSGAPVEGLNTFKLFVTAGPADFSFLRQEGVRSGAPVREGGLTAAERLMRKAFDGTATRSATFSAAEEDTPEDWTTIERPFLIRERTAAALDTEGAPVELGGVTIQTPGLTGEARVHEWGSDRAEAAGMSRDALLVGLESGGLEIGRTLEIEGSRARGGATRGVEHGSPAVRFELDDPGQDFGQMVMTTHASGVISWNFGEPTEPPATRSGDRSGRAKRSYEVPMADAPTDAPKTRGIGGIIGKTILKELVFPILDPVFGKVGDHFAARCEKRWAPYRLRTFAPDDFTEKEVAEVDGEMWEKLSSGRALLFLHGPLRRSHTSFHTLPRDFLDELHGRYDGRVFAFDHFTVSDDPTQNAARLLEMMPPEIDLELDIIGHSRGGLVGRALAEGWDDLPHGSRRVKVGNVIFAGTPNAGTALADAKHIGKLLNRYTSMLNVLDFLPDTGVGEVLTSIVSIVKQVAVGAYGGLDGIQAMRPGGKFLNGLNTRSGPEGVSYFALSSDLRGEEGALKSKVFDAMLGQVFGKIGNDLIVPTRGVFEIPGEPANGDGALFPIERRVVLEGPDAVGHTGYFANQQARAKIQEWLSA